MYIIYYFLSLKPYLSFLILRYLPNLNFGIVCNADKFKKFFEFNHQQCLLSQTTPQTHATWTRCLGLWYSLCCRRVAWVGRHYLRGTWRSSCWIMCPRYGYVVCMFVFVCVCMCICACVYECITDEWLNVLHVSLSVSIKNIYYSRCSFIETSIIAWWNSFLFLQSVLIEASKRNELMANKSTVSNSWFELLNTEVLLLNFLFLNLFRTFNPMLRLTEVLWIHFYAYTHAMPWLLVRLPELTWCIISARTLCYVRHTNVLTFIVHQLIITLLSGFNMGRRACKRRS